MKKNTLFLCVCMCICICLVMAACTSASQNDTTGSTSPATTTKESDKTEDTKEESTPTLEGKKIGVTFDTLENPVWAELLKIAKEYAESFGMEMTYVGCNSDIATQISQIENFIQSGVDAIIICASDPTALSDITKRAMDEGIYVVSYTRDLENTHVNYTADWIDVGYALGETCAKWINEKYSDAEKVEFAALTIRTTDLANLQSDAMINGVLDNAPNAVLVQEQITENPVAEVGMSNVENIMQAHPDVKAIISIGAYGGVGGNEALKTILSPDEYDSIGLFTIDATEEECLNIQRGDPQKASISLGSGGLHGRTMVDICKKLFLGEKVDKMYYMEPLAVDKSNVAEYYEEVYGK